MKIQGKVFVVTGAGSGIGRALTLALLQGGARVAGADLKAESLKETATLANAGDAFSTHVVDITNRSQVEALRPAVVEAHGVVDGLINNAGIIQPFVNLIDLDYATMERVFNINLYGQIHMLKTFIPELLKRPEAHIVNVSSMAGFFPFPGQSIYGASKAALKILTEGLYAELLDAPVGVTVVFPGAIATNITANSGITSLNIEAGPRVTSAEVAAATILKAIEKNQLQVYVGKDAVLMNLLYKLSPKGAIQMVKKQMEGILPK